MSDSLHNTPACELDAAPASIEPAAVEISPAAAGSTHKNGFTADSVTQVTQPDRNVASLEETTEQPETLQATGALTAPAGDLIVGTPPAGDSSSNKAWTAELVAEAVARRDRGESASVIGAALGFSRNAVIGKLNRHARPEPKGAPRVNWNSPESIQTLTNALARGLLVADIATLFGATIGATYKAMSARGLKANRAHPKTPAQPTIKRNRRSKPPVPVRALQRPKSWMGISLMDLTTTTCCWPDGDGPNYLYCGDPTADRNEGRVYCAYHASIAYRRIA